MTILNIVIMKNEISNIDGQDDLVVVTFGKF